MGGRGGGGGGGRYPRRRPKIIAGGAEGSAGIVHQQPGPGAAHGAFVAHGDDGSDGIGGAARDRASGVDGDRREQVDRAQATRGGGSGAGKTSPGCNETGDDAIK